MIYPKVKGTPYADFVNATVAYMEASDQVWDLKGADGEMEAWRNLRWARRDLNDAWVQFKQYLNLLDQLEVET